MTCDDVAAISRLLRTSEVLRLVSRVSSEAGKPALLVLVCHIAQSAAGLAYEEAAVFLCPLRESGDPVIQTVVPIQREFVFTSELRESPVLSFVCPIHPHRTPATVRVVAGAATNLDDWTSETSRLHDIARKHLPLPAISHAWLEEYAVLTLQITESGQDGAEVRHIAPATTTGRFTRSLADTRATLISAASSIHGIREDWVAQQMLPRLADFSEQIPLNLFIGSYNVAESIATEPLDAWLADACDADVVVVGLQEVDMRPQNLLSGHISSTRENAWSVALLTALAKVPGEPFVELARKSLGSVAIHAFCRGRLQGKTEVSSSALATGPGRTAGKGAVALRIRLYDCVFNFVDAHLAAFEHAVERRNEEIRLIFQRLSFPSLGAIEAHIPRLPLAQLAGQGTIGVSGCHALFVFGDLNYRIKMTSADAKHYVKRQAWARLLEADQLRQEMAHRRVLSAFSEGQLHFSPTYKYDKGSIDTYDTSEKQRTPSWTDRILWLSKEADVVRQTSLKPHKLYVASDHKPISSTFHLSCVAIDEAQQKSARMAVLKQLDAFENDSMPDIELWPGHEVAFASIRYNESQNRSLVLKNVTSAAVAEYAFLPKPVDGEICRPWLDVRPRTGLILPGESQTVIFTVHVDHANVASLNFALEEIQDVLVLSLLKGRDLFVTIQAPSFERTCFGNSLERLARLRAPIRSTQDTKLREIASEAEVEPCARYEIPGEILRLTNILAERDALNINDLFLDPGEPTLISVIRTCLDTGDSFPDTIFTTSGQSATLDFPSGHGGHDEHDGPVLQSAIGLYSVASCLIQLLESLSAPVVPSDLLPAALAAGDRGNSDRALELAQAFPPVHAAVFLHCVALLKADLAMRSERSARDGSLSHLSAVWAKALMRPLPGHKFSKPERLKAQAFLRLFLRDGAAA